MWWTADRRREEMIWEFTFPALSRHERTASAGSCSHKWCWLDSLNDGMLKFHMKLNDFHICRSSSVALVMLIKWCDFSGSAWGSCQAVTEDSIWGNNSASKIQMASNLLGFLFSSRAVYKLYCWAYNNLCLTQTQPCWHLRHYFAKLFRTPQVFA